MTGLKKGERRKEDESITGMPFALHLALRNNARANMKPVRLGVMCPLARQASIVYVLTGGETTGVHHP
ncbi:unnamed protein product [Clonostachys chloroleuca]|uniref:Uncharacterized protein n=1 Tax=Clonostachys chloroleuca TaxID=1926264 RepID=A0AA35MFZ3_9HYPO|nr:unnamed protein product [Clonostachys chloroleuca]